MKNLVKITEPYLMAEAQQIVKNIHIGNVISTINDNYTVMEITDKTVKYVTTTIMEWRPEKKIINKNKLQDLLEQGKAEIK